jgi:hypothetical protein
MGELREIGLQQDGSFRFHIPVDLKKSEDGKVWIHGIASLETPDIAGETVIQKGMDLSYFLNRGFFNDNHDKTTGGKIGIPTEAKTTKDGLFVKGYLLDTPRAQKIVELAEALDNSGGQRKLGFSIEGKVKQRDGRIIKKSWLKDVAITAEPVHPDTYMNIVKSLSARIEEKGYIDEEGAIRFLKENGEEEVFWAKLGDLVSKSVSKELGQLRKSLPKLKEIEGEETDKALEAGCQRPVKDGGSALRKEQLESDLHNLDIPQEEEEEETKGKRLTKSQAFELIKSRGYTQPVAERMAALLFDGDIRDFLNQIQ